MGSLNTFSKDRISQHIYRDCARRGINLSRDDGEHTRLLIPVKNPLLERRWKRHVDAD